MIIYGVHPVTEALRSTTGRPECIWISREKSGERLEKIARLARERGVPVRFESTKTLTKKAATSRHQEVVAQLAAPTYLDLDHLLEQNPTLLVLVDGVEDPHNLGALLRTADAAGVEGILLPQRRSCGITPAVVRASAGATLHLNISRVGNIVHALEVLKQRGFWIVGLDMRGQTSLQQLDAHLPTALVVGGEHQGVRKVVLQHCDFLVSLPMRGMVSSLNLSVAAGIALYQLALGREEDETTR